MCVEHWGTWSSHLVHILIQGGGALLCFSYRWCPQGLEGPYPISVWEIRSKTKIWTQGFGLYFNTVPRFFNAILGHTNLEEMISLGKKADKYSSGFFQCVMVYHMVSPVDMKRFSLYYIGTTLFLFNPGCWQGKTMILEKRAWMLQLLLMSSILGTDADVCDKTYTLSQHCRCHWSPTALDTADSY